jgi:hypothetical protein
MFCAVHVGYHIYCPNQQIIPSLLLHELVHVGQFVNAAGRSVAKFGRIYLQQYCDAGYYRGIPWEQEAYERAKVLDPYNPPPGKYKNYLYSLNVLPSAQGQRALAAPGGNNLWSITRKEGEGGQRRTAPCK